MQTPENPYEGFPNPNDPLPPPPPTTPPPYPPPYPTGAPMGYPPRGPQISFDVISQAWTVLQSAMGVYIGATFVAGIPAAIGYMVYFADIIKATQANARQPDINPATVLVMYAGLGICYFLLFGVLRMAINHLKTGHANFSDVLSFYDVFFQLLLALIVVGLAVTVGLCLCLIPGLLLQGLYLFVWPLILDQKMGPIQAMKTSYETLKSQMWMALLFFFVLSLIGQAGAMACGIGALFTVPLAIISLAITYRNFFPDGGTGFNFPGQGGPVAPIANPFG